MEQQIKPPFSGERERERERERESARERERGMEGGKMLDLRRLESAELTLCGWMLGYGFG